MTPAPSWRLPENVFGRKWSPFAQWLARAMAVVISWICQQTVNKRVRLNFVVKMFVNVPVFSLGLFISPGCAQSSMKKGMDHVPGTQERSSWSSCVCIYINQRCLTVQFISQSKRNYGKITNWSLDDDSIFELSKEWASSLSWWGVFLYSTKHPPSVLCGLCAVFNPIYPIYVHHW